MATSKSWVLKFGRADEINEPILIQVTQSAEDDLHLDLTGTDGEAVYSGKVRPEKLDRLRQKNNTSADNEFAAILRYVLVSRQETNLSNAQKGGLEVVAEIERKHSKRRLHIVLRNHVGDISQKLGTIELKETDAEINVLAWTAQAVERADGLQRDIEVLNQQLQDARDATKTLHDRLEELVKAKNDHEDQLLAKFVLLLNEKKLKIRSQQRVLASIDPDRPKSENLEVKQESQSQKARGHTPQKSSMGKRKAKQSEPSPLSDVDSSDGFEKMQVDAKTEAEEDEAANSDKDVDMDGERQTTPETASDTESDDLAAPSKPTKAAPAVGRRGGRSKVKSKSKSPEKATQKPPERLPGRRELPFAAKGKTPTVERREKTPPSVVPKQRASDEETESDDDEL